ncbi:FAS1-like dehydratase domain-containing protein [Shimia sediminis]|uniref:FAS1-like dehydratase domain-containing protein n=1 Tax=Shimia sediminis TaxID=2497945 RepID=UPI000F8D7103|nr:MaoC family dehydratase N-terminal domain-containing protein [Shimia sediminis]
MNDDLSQAHSQSDVMDPARAAACLATLDLPSEVALGDALPPFFHYLYFWEARPPGHLGRDGHPKVGGVIPDMGLPRRMWAGGQLEFHAPLRAGIEATKTTTVASANYKEGRTGPLGFVKLRHAITQGGQLCVTEYQDLVYREDPDPGAPKPVPPVARRDEVKHETMGFDTTMLFRYSALTFNGHRIHYDVNYAKTVEGYDGLVVHGPLLAQLLMLMAERELGSLRRFSFRATAPLMHFEKATFCWGGDGTCWVRGPDGRQNMLAEVG